MIRVQRHHCACPTVVWIGYAPFMGPNRTVIKGPGSDGLNELKACLYATLPEADRSPTRTSGQFDDHRIREWCERGQVDPHTLAGEGRYQARGYGATRQDACC